MRVFEGKAKVKYLVLIGAILVVLAPLFVFISNAAADPCARSTYNDAQCKAKRDTLAREIQRNKELAAQKKKEAQELQKIISQIDRDIANTQYKINKTQSEIDAIVKQIAQKEKELAIEQENQNEALRVMYETTNQTTLEILIGSETLSEVVTYAEYLEALEIKIENTMAEIERLKRELEKQKEELEGLKRQLEAYKQGLAIQMNEKNQALAGVKVRQKELEKIISEMKIAFNDVNSEIARQQRQLSGDKMAGLGYWLLDPLDFVYSGRFIMPFNGPITVRFKELIYYPWLGRTILHEGIDIDGVIDDPIKAADSGIVISATWKGGYGQVIEINHGDVNTLYGHLSGFNVERGQRVNKGDVIGYMGNTGWCIPVGGGDGSHLHFEVRQYEK